MLFRLNNHATAGYTSNVTLRSPDAQSTRSVSSEDTERISCYASLLQICSAIFASQFSTRNKVKAILQTAYEYLRADSIIAYEYNRLTSQLAIITMPGVKQHEFMRGPNTTLVFHWDEPPKGHKDPGVWLENRLAFGKYLTELEAGFLKCEPKKPLPQKGTFRDRENPNAATAKICLWKGLDQTDDRVGQVFFNFTKSETTVDIFNPWLKQIICDICVFIRESLIDQMYHEDPTSAWAKQVAPERFLLEVNQRFALPFMGDSQRLDDLERDVASKVCDMVGIFTENIGGHVELALLDERSLAKVYVLGAKEKRPVFQIIQSGSLTGKCIADRGYVVASDMEKASPAVMKAFNTFAEFNSVSCKSLMLLPIIHEGEVRGVVRLTNPRSGFFRDAHARAMQEIELVALHCLLRVDECRQRLRMTSALDFYTASQFLPGNESFWSVLMKLPNAFGAVWGTYWRVRLHLQDGVFQAQDGVKFTADEVVPPDEDCDIRTGRFTLGRVVGLSQLLYQMNQSPLENVFLCLHVLRYGANAKYLLRFYSSCPFVSNSKNNAERVLSDGFHLLEFTEMQNLPWCNGPLALNPNTTKTVHTRIAFVVREKRAIKGIVWLKFDDIHSLDWWERRYIVGLSAIIGRLEGRFEFQLVLKGFGHFQLDLCKEGMELARRLRTGAGSQEELLYMANVCRRNFQFLWNQADDMRIIRRALQLSNDKEDAETASTAAIIEGPIREFVEDVIDWESRGQRGNVYEVKYEPERIADDQVKSVFCTVLLHLVDNAVIYGLKRLAENDLRKIVIWVREVENRYETIVADSGRELTNDPLNELIGLVEKDDPDHGSGLRVCRILLADFNGSIKWIPRQEFISEFGTTGLAAQTWLQNCNTFLCFTVPR